MNIADLPPEIHTYILTFLSSKEITKVSVCSQFFYAASRVESLWKQKCRTEYGVTDISGWNDFTYYDIYSKVLFKYGYTFGLWQPELGYYGGLVHVKFLGPEGQVRATQYLPPASSDVKKCLRQKPLFSVGINENGEVEPVCHKGFSESHPCKLIQSNFSCNPSRTDKFVYKCSESVTHDHALGNGKEFELWLLEENSSLDVADILLQTLFLLKFNTMKEYSYCYNLKRIALSPTPNGIISPGLFKGNYGAHGCEIIQLIYNTDDHTAEGLKISGDPNVTAGAITFKIDLARPMILSKQQQSTVELLEQIDTPDFEMDVDPNNMPEQLFKIPDDCSDRSENPPSRCIGRFHGQGQIAAHGYQNPSFIKSHWIVFNENLFGLLWLELRSFSLYSRITEDFS